MKYNRLIFSTIVCFLTLFACSETPKEQQNTSEQQGDNVIMIPTEGSGQVPVDLDTFNQAPRNISSQSEKSVQSITVEPKHQVGLITADMTEEDIKKLYGESKVVRVDRGDVKTSVFPNTDKELEITWKKGHDFKKLETAIIRKGDWKTSEGIGIGTTVDELNKINGKPIELFQREENYAMVRWKGGKVNPKLKAIVDTDKRKVIEMQIDF